MDLVLRGLTWESVLVYIDDIVVYAHTFADLKMRLEEVLTCLRGANMKLKPTKVKMFQREIPFLRHRISGVGVAMDPDNITYIVRWHWPTTVHEMRQFLGLCGYYRRYVRDYSKIATSFYGLTKRGETFEWTTERNSAFELLKEKLVTAPILAMSKDTGAYTLDVDASNWAVGAVLQQEQEGLLRVIGYASKSFTAAEQRYCITRKKLAGMIFGLKHYRQYLLGRQFTVRTDHAALSYLLIAKDLIGQQARWVNLMSE